MNFANFKRGGIRLNRAALHPLDHPITRTCLILLIVFSLSSCSLYTSASSITAAALRRVGRILQECGKIKILGRQDFDPSQCVADYAARKNISVAAVIVDGHGQYVVFERSGACEEVDVLPYSKGKNRIDECGSGDDVHLR